MILSKKEARDMVAQKYGFHSWQTLVLSVPDRGITVLSKEAQELANKRLFNQQIASVKVLSDVEVNFNERITKIEDSLKKFLDQYKYKPSEYPTSSGLDFEINIDTSKFKRAIDNVLNGINLVNAAEEGRIFMNGGKKFKYKSLDEINKIIGDNGTWDIQGTRVRSHGGDFWGITADYLKTDLLFPSESEPKNKADFEKKFKGYYLPDKRYENGDIVTSNFVCYQKKWGYFLDQSHPKFNQNWKTIKDLRAL